MLGQEIMVVLWFPLGAPLGKEEEIESMTVTVDPLVTFGKLT